MMWRTDKEILISIYYYTKTLTQILTHRRLHTIIRYEIARIAHLFLSPFLDKGRAGDGFLLTQFTHKKSSRLLYMWPASQDMLTDPWISIQTTPDTSTVQMLYFQMLWIEVEYTTDIIFIFDWIECTGRVDDTATWLTRQDRRGQQLKL